MVQLQELNKNQMVKLLDAINRERVEGYLWSVSSYSDSWNAAYVFSSTNQAEEFAPGDYITVMYDEDNMFPTFGENLNIVTDFPHYDYCIEDALRVLIFKI